MTNCRAGAVCQAKAPPDAVSWKEMVATASLLLSQSPRGLGLSSMTPSSKYELWSSPVHKRTHRIIWLLLCCLLRYPTVLLTSYGRLEWNDGLRIEDRVEAAPGLVSDHLPVVTGSARVLREEHVASAERKSPLRRFEFQRAAQRDDQLS